MNSSSPKKGSGPFFRALGSAYAQNCPTIDTDKQTAEELACRALGGAWARHGVRDSCAERTADAGKIVGRVCVE